jgi:bifunctional non-homologous end joining protein LigD
MMTGAAKLEGIRVGESLPASQAWKKPPVADYTQAWNHYHPALQQILIVKKHHATRLHYDFRLGYNGVLMSWVIPDGPSYWPGDQCEAIQVADHRREGPCFEGVFPSGRYGAGPVMVWDWGIWVPMPGYTDVGLCLRNGFLKFMLLGEKLKGIWILKRVKSFPRNRRDPIWVLMKEQDLFARSKTAMSIVEEAPNSVISGRTLEGIAKDWNRGKGKNELQGELFPE